MIKRTHLKPAAAFFISAIAAVMFISIAESL